MKDGLFDPLFIYCFIGILLGVLLSVISTVASIGTAALFFYGLVNTLNGRALELPVIGKITLIK